MKIQKGNLLDAAERGDVGIIMHGCNCFHAMGSGIAGEIAKRYPDVPRVDREETNRGDPSKLGSFTAPYVAQKAVKTWDEANVLPKNRLVPLDNPFLCINLYTQFKPGPDFIASVFPTAVRDINKRYHGKTIGIPLIGCGIGGGDWGSVMETLLTEGHNINWEVHVL